MKSNVREFREKKGFTQEEVARRAGVRRETIVFLEQGKYNPSLRLAFRLAEIFDTTTETLFSFSDEK
jgi:putative transcriptional regulator